MTTRTIEHDGPVLEKVGAHEAIDCTRCGYIHIRPVPSLEELQKLYREKFYGEDKKDYLKRMEEDSDWWNMVYEGRLEVMERLLDPAAGKRILDAGCSGGFFLRKARSRGWQAQGIEMARQAAEYARRQNLDVIQDDIHNVDLAATGPYSAIYCSFVLEHLPNPKAVLKKFHDALVPGGVVCAEVPNDFNPLQHIVKTTLGAEPYWVAPDHHINYFTPRSLQRLFEAAGFECAELEGTFPMELFLLMGDNYIGDDPAGRRLHAKRKRFETLLHRGGMKDFKRELYRFCIGRQVGREVVIYARKHRGKA